LGRRQFVADLIALPWTCHSRRIVIQLTPPTQPSDQFQAVVGVGDPSDDLHLGTASAAAAHLDYLFG
jgi:hypothetical protein